MPQEQNAVPLGTVGWFRKEGGGNGQQADWVCPCGRELPLVGRSGLARGVTSGFRVDCPDCDRRFFVVPDSGDMKKALLVEEVR